MSSHCLNFRTPVHHKLLLCLIISVAVASRVGLELFTHFTQEDAFITLRYAENIARGSGFVYNTGERVLGTTTPLYTLLLAAFASAELPALMVGKAINIAADGALCYVVYLLLSEVDQRDAGIIAAFLIAINPTEMRVSISGQESCLVALSESLVWLFYLRRQYLWLYIAAGVLFLLRWDGLLLIGVVTAAIAIRDHRLPWKEIIGIGLICCPWLIFASMYFGSPIPVTLASKAIVYGWYFRGIVFPELGGLLNKLTATPNCQIVLLSLLVGFARIVDKKLWQLLPILVWFAVYWIAFICSKLVLFEWYFIPTLFVYLSLAGLGFSWTLDSLPGNWTQTARSWFIAVIIVSFLPQSLMGTFKYTKSLQRIEDGVRLPLGTWLKQNAAPNDTVMLEPIGYIGYYSGLRVLDMTGLVSPSVIPYYKDHRSICPWYQIAEARHPEWCVLRPGEASLAIQAANQQGHSWAQQYRLVKTFSAPSESNPKNLQTEFEIFRRIDVSSVRL